MAKILKIYKDRVYYGSDPEGANRLVGIQVEDGAEVYEAFHCLTPTDNTGFSPEIREWLEKNKRSYTVKEFVPEITVPAIPVSISDRQFFQQLALDGLITEAEALNAVKSGEMPAAFETFINGLDPAKRFSAKMVLSGATTFERAHPLVEAFGTMQGMTPIQIDDLWVRAASL